LSAGERATLLASRAGQETAHRLHSRGGSADGRLAASVPACERVSGPGSAYHDAVVASRLAPRSTHSGSSSDKRSAEHEGLRGWASFAAALEAPSRPNSQSTDDSSDCTDDRLERAERLALRRCKELLSHDPRKGRWWLLPAPTPASLLETDSEGETERSRIAPPAQPLPIASPTVAWRANLLQRTKLALPSALDAVVEQLSRPPARGALLAGLYTALAECLSSCWRVLGTSLGDALAGCLARGLVSEAPEAAWAARRGLRLLQWAFALPGPESHSGAAQRAERLSGSYWVVQAELRGSARVFVAGEDQGVDDIDNVDINMGIGIGTGRPQGPLLPAQGAVLWEALCTRLQATAESAMRRAQGNLGVSAEAEVRVALAAVEALARCVFLFTLPCSCYLVSFQIDVCSDTNDYLESLRLLIWHSCLKYEQSMVELRVIVVIDLSLSPSPFRSLSVSIGFFVWV
jgi:hypothetical protein